MIASYVAAVSAFSVNNFRFLPIFVRWVWPTAKGVPVMRCGFGTTKRNSENTS